MNLSYPNIDPVMFHLGPLPVYWYGLMYVIGFTMSYMLVRLQIRRRDDAPLAKHFENLNLVLILSVILGGRFGYILIYNFSHYLANPFEIFDTRQGGMSFHGACIALILAGWVFCHLKKLDFWKTADMYVVTIPIGLGLGRIGNFINGELFGRVSEVPWAMVFPYGGPLPRHPSQLYEALLEGIFLFILLWLLKNRPYEDKINWPHGSMLALFLSSYGVIRFAIEFVREPDQQMGYFFQLLTMGQILSAMMIIGGLLLWWIRKGQIRNKL